MTALLAGIDWSTKAIHAALIALDADHGDPTTPPVTFGAAELQGRDMVTRCQSVPEAMRGLLAPLSGGHDVASVWIEEAYGNHRTADRALLPIQGAIIASCRHRQVATLTAVEWRKHHGFVGHVWRNHPKLAAHFAAAGWLTAQGVPPPDDFSDHHADALLLALAAREITWRAAA